MVDMYGKIFESLYTGSMVGAGSPVFAVWGYVIANMKPDSEVGSQVELNPRLLAYILGDTEEVVQGAIDKLCAPDPESRTKEAEGRRLIRLGQYAYQVVNGPKYHAIKHAEQQRESARERKRRQRARLPGKSSTASERLREQAAKNNDAGTIAALDRMEGLTPPGKTLCQVFAEEEAATVPRGTFHLPESGPESLQPPGSSAAETPALPPGPVQAGPSESTTSLPAPEYEEEPLGPDGLPLD